MPRISRKSKRAKIEWTAMHVRALLSGHDFFFVFGLDDAEQAHERKREAWEQLRYHLLPEFIAEHPGRRPWAWWAFDCQTGPRRMLVKASNVGWRPIGKALSFGVPRMFEPCECHDKREGFPPLESMYETETDYLARHGLLSDEEREALRNCTVAT